jgi:hypothetical protein
LRRRTLPGQPKRWSDPPLVDLRALTCVSTIHIARRCPPKGSRRAMPFFGQSTGRTRPWDRSARLLPGEPGEHMPPRRRRSVTRSPSPGAETRSAGRNPAPLPPRRQIGDPITVPPRPRRPANRPPLPETSDLGDRRTDLRLPELGLGSRLPGPLTLDAVHADPVNRAIALTPPELRLPSSWGARSARPGTSPRHPAVARRLTARSLWLLAPTGPAFTSWTEPVTAPVPIRGSVVCGSVSRPRLACASRYEWILSRTRNPWSSGIFESPRLSPELFVNPQNFGHRPPFVHRRRVRYPHGFPPRPTRRRMNRG